MATVKFEHGKWDSFLGYICGQCGAICPFVQGGINHENMIEENGGVCPRVEEREEEERRRMAEWRKSHKKED